VAFLQIFPAEFGDGLGFSWSNRLHLAAAMGNSDCCTDSRLKMENDWH
jgi:hypothetical protein